MPPLSHSRYIFTKGIQDEDGNLFLTDREPFRFVASKENRFHTAVLGNTLHNLAERYFPSFDNAANLWWVIADYQPEPILDPTLALTPGRVLVIPSERAVREDILSESRREE